MKWMPVVGIPFEAAIAIFGAYAYFVQGVTAGLYLLGLGMGVVLILVIQADRWED